MALRPRAGGLHRAEHQLVQALRGRRPGRRSTWSGAATTARPASGSSATGPALHIENRFPGGDMNAVPDVCGGHRRRAAGHRARASSRRPSTAATATWRQAATACRARCTRRSASSRQRGRGRDLRARTSWPTTSTRRGSSRSRTTRSSILGPRALPGARLMRLQDKVAIITGAGGGMGRVAAQMFAAEGAKVVVAEFDEAAGRETVAPGDRRRRPGHASSGPTSREEADAQGEWSTRRSRPTAGSTCSTTTPGSCPRPTTR